MKDQFDWESEHTPVVDLPTGKETAKSESGRRRRLSFASWVDLVSVSQKSTLQRVTAVEAELRTVKEEHHDMNLEFQKHRVLTVGEKGDNGKIGVLRADVDGIKGEAASSVRLVKRFIVAAILAIGGSLGSGWVAIRDTVATNAVRANEITHLREEMSDIKKKLDKVTDVLMHRKD